MRTSVHRIAMLGSVAVLLLASAVSGQGRQPATPADELLAEEADLQRLLAAEQSRWAGFNAQIEELERAAAAVVR